VALNFWHALLAGLAIFATSDRALAQPDRITQQCFSTPTQDCLLEEATAHARDLSSIGGIVDGIVVGTMANVARALAKLGHKEQADRAFADADAQAKRARNPDGSDLQFFVVRALFDAGRVDEAMLRTKTVKGPGIAEAAIDALIAAGRLSEAESFLASTQSWNSNTEHKKLAEAYIEARLTDKALSLIKPMADPYRTYLLTDAFQTAERTGHPEVVAQLLASLPDDPARQAMRQTMQQYSSGTASTTAFSSALEKGNFDEALNILTRPEMTANRPGLLSSVAAAACKAGKKDLASKLDNDMLAALAAVKSSPSYPAFMIRRGVAEAKCNEDQLATATFAETRKYIDAQPKYMHAYLDGLLAEGYVLAGNIQPAIETARLSGNLSTVKRLVSAMAKAGYVREALEYLDKEAKVDLSDMLIVVAENMPTKATP
jgi:hypothetical protein